jgi:hypothetical protein
MAKLTESLGIAFGLDLRLSIKRPSNMVSAMPMLPDLFAVPGVFDMRQELGIVVDSFVQPILAK